MTVESSGKSVREAHGSLGMGRSLFSQTFHRGADIYDLIAHEIVTHIKPQSALVVGCQSGQIVARLRSAGIDTDGIEFPHTVSQGFLPAIQEYCKIVNPSEALENHYELAILIEAVDKLHPEEIETLIHNVCQAASQVIFSSDPFSLPGSVGEQIRSPGDWAALFAGNGFTCVSSRILTNILPWVMHLQRLDQPASQLIGDYENRLWQYRYENLARIDHIIYQRQELSFAQNQEMINQLIMEKAKLSQEKDEIFNHYLNLVNSRSWRLMQAVHRIRHKLIPLGSRREHLMHNLLTDLRHPFKDWGRNFEIEPVTISTDLTSHKGSVDIIICVHNALTDVKICLDSIVQNTTQPYNIILVDDGSDQETGNYLDNFTEENACQLIRNQTARGYTFAANQGLRLSRSDYALLINSDTIVSPEWLDRMFTCAESDSRIGIVGPLSNTASWQSIPEIESDGDWADNPLPEDLSIPAMAGLVSQYSGKLYPPMEFLNGFCLLIRKEVIKQIGVFDEENFGVGYGEEDDYCLRAKKAGWILALADDVYIYHAQSRSYSDTRRKKLYEQAGESLADKHGHALIETGVIYSMTSPVLEGIRARSAYLHQRREYTLRGKAEFAGKRVLFVLPVNQAGGGSNVVISEANAMRSMGVDVQIFNLQEYEQGFKRSSPSLDIPVNYGQIFDIPGLASEFDAVIATFNTSVSWIAHAEKIKPDLVFGYYVQGFEPLIYPEGSADYQNALDSYTLIDGMILFCKTDWVHQQILDHTGSRITNIGVSMNTELNRPRPRKHIKTGTQPIRIGAMVRPASLYRAPELTMKILKRAAETFGSRIQVITFGMDAGNDEFQQFETDFAWMSAGELNPLQVARYMNEIDIFVDFSSHQAMGLSALEAMACGAAVILPIHGGATDFAVHESNSLVIDTLSESECWEALNRLIIDDELRSRLQKKALTDVCQYYPEKPAYNILSTLFLSQR